MTIALYHSAYSTCSQKVRLVLNEKKLDFESIEINFRKEEHLTEEYLAINPNGVVPTLVKDGVSIMDSSCIIEYLDEVFTEIPLSGLSPEERAFLRVWLRFMEEVPTSAIRVPSFEAIFLPSLRVIQTGRGFNKATAKRTIRQGFYEKMGGGKGFSNPEIVNSLRGLKITIERMQKSLQSGPWLMGENITLVDLAMVPLIDRAEDIGMAYLWAAAPEVQDWLERLQNRPSFTKAFYKGSRLSERLEFKLAFARLKKTGKAFQEAWNHTVNK